MVPPPSRYTFVDDLEDQSGSGPHTTTADGRSIVRSRAMQLVWDQRSKRNSGRLRENIEIVVETQDSYDRKEAAKAEARKRPSATVRHDVRSEGDSSNPTVLAKEQTIKFLPRQNSEDHSEISISDLAEEIPNDEPLSKSREEDPPVDVQRDVAVQRALQEAAMEVVVRQHGKRQQQHEALDISWLDPFQRACIHVDSQTNAYLHHYFQALSWKFTMPKTTWLRYAMEDVGLLHSILFVASAHYAFSVHKRQVLTIDARRHAARTIQYIKQCMQDPTRQCSDAVIGAIGRVITWSIIQGDRETYSKHMRHVGKMIQMRSGLDNLGFDGQLKYLMCCNICGGASVWMNDIPQLLRYPYGSLNHSALEDVPETPIAEDTASSFVALRDDGWVPDDVADVCIAMAKLDIASSEQENLFIIDDAAKTRYGHCSNKLALRLMYGSHREAAKFMGGVPQIDVFIREITRTTLLCYLYAFQRESPPFSYPIRSNLKRIRLWMEKSKMLPNLKVDNAWGGGRLGGLLFWSLMITGALTLNPSDRLEIMQQLRVVADEMKINAWQRVQQVCRSFLWQQPLCEKKCTLFWNDTFYFQPVGLMSRLSLGQTPGAGEEIDRPATASRMESFIQHERRDAFRESNLGIRPGPSHSRSSETYRVRAYSPQLTIPSLSTDDGTSGSDDQSMSISPPLRSIEFIDESIKQADKARSNKPQTQTQGIRFEEPYVGLSRQLQPQRSGQSKGKTAVRRSSLENAPPRLKKTGSHTKGHGGSKHSGGRGS